jgi:hypothetical protein
VHDLFKSLVENRVAKARENLKSIPDSVISVKDKAELEEELTLVLDKEAPENDDFALLKRIEMLIEKRAPKKPAPPKQPTYFEMLSSIIDWKIEGLRRELTTGKVRPGPEMNQAEAWLMSSCPALFTYCLKLENAGLIERTDKGFNWRCRQAAIVTLLRRCGFNDWKGFTRHCLVNGKPPKEGSLKNQNTASSRPPKDWDKILAAIPDLNS